MDVITGEDLDKLHAGGALLPSAEGSIAQGVKWEVAARHAHG